MNAFSVKIFKELAHIHHAHSISIYIPTHRAGMEVNEKIDQLNLKNQVQKVTRELESMKLDNREIDQLLAPVNGLLEDTGFWSNQSEGLAIFCNKERFEFYTLPVVFQEFTYVSDHFYLTPMISYLNDDGKFYLLALSLSEVKVFEGFSHQINEVTANDMLPGQLEDVVGYDVTEKHLQYRTGQTGTENTLYHGHGKGTESEKHEVLKYFRAVNDGLMKIIQNQNRPLVIATVDYLFPMYKEVNEYKNLVKGFIAGNPEHADAVLLHNKAKALLQDYFSRHRMKFWQKFEYALKNNPVSFDEEEIISAAYNHRVETLIVKKHENLWGVFDPETNTVSLREQQPQFKSCMINLAAVHTILNGGNVYVMEPGEMPEPGVKLNAIFRF